MLVFGGVPILGEIIQFDYLPGVSNPRRHGEDSMRYGSTLFFFGGEGEKVYLTAPTRKECHLKRDHFERKTQLNIYFTYIIYKNHQFSGDIPYFLGWVYHFALGIVRSSPRFPHLSPTMRWAAFRRGGARRRTRKKIGDVCGVRKSGW